VVEIFERACDLFVSSVEQRVDRAARLLAENVRELLHRVAGLLLLLRPLGRLLSAWRRRHAWKNVPMREIIGLGPKT
jgi:heme A synthase